MLGSYVESAALWLVACLACNDAARCGCLLFGHPRCPWQIPDDGLAPDWLSVGQLMKHAVTQVVL